MALMAAHGSCVRPWVVDAMRTGVCVCVVGWLGWSGSVALMAAVCGHGSWTPCVLVFVCALLAGWIGVGVWRSWLLCAAMGLGRHE